MRVLLVKHIFERKTSWRREPHAKVLSYCVYEIALVITPLCEKVIITLMNGATMHRSVSSIIIRDY